MEENFIKIWSQALEILQEEISPVGYKTYVEVMVPRIVDGNTLCFLSPSNSHLDICNKRYLDLIENTLTFLTKKSYTITFEAKEIIPENIQENNEPLNFDDSEPILQTPNEEISNKNITQNKITNENKIEPSRLNPRYT